MSSGIGLFCFHWHYVGRESLYSLYILGKHYLIIVIWAALLYCAITYLTAVILCTDKRWATLAFAQGITKVSISFSFITLTMWLMVGVPKITETLAAKLDMSRITRAIWSSS